ncbi:Nucleoporin [Psilocybe cubensis]|uniref:Nucleoporin n=2 Tax=Psilocybe cubensis TaxID=181762 RepID=A0ACB8HF65_PSICU|nr:Nucleoporin [Psilocybe cubensis]KAH9486481.1 Nucleoporin [Psilocybe cubensis]
MSTPISGAKKAPSNPLIPEKYLDVPTQRLYFLSLGLLCQSIKILDFVWSLAASDGRLTTCRKWLFFDLAYCVVLSQLRIPRLTYSKASVILQICSLWFLDALLFGGISINAPALLGSIALTSQVQAPDVSLFRGLIAPLSFGMISSAPNSGDPHLLGQHTVRMSPISTAHLNPENLNFCLPSSNTHILLPIVLNNTNVVGLKYSLTPLGYDEDGVGKVEIHEVNAKALKSAEDLYKKEMMVAAQSGPSLNFEDEYDEYDDDDDTEAQGIHTTLQQTQSLIHIAVSRAGVIRLEQVYDSSNVEARLVVSKAVVVPCPSVEFAEDEGSAKQNIRCAGQESHPELKINVHGVPPLSLRWLKTVNGHREQFLVEGIEGEHKDKKRRHSEVTSSDVKEPTTALVLSRVPDAQKVSIPLTVTLEKAGTYLYALEEITDGVGNTVRMGYESTTAEPNFVSKTKTTRSFTVLQKPAVSFSGCTIDSPTKLTVGEEKYLKVTAIKADLFDAPWDITLNYRPPIDGDVKRGKPWNKNFKIKAGETGLSVPAYAPGEYRLLSVKGKYCTGTVMAPDACKVVQVPMPSAEIEWKRIHECSGDTGISSTIILHGTPPFMVYYTVKRDNEPAREIAKRFHSSRNELTFQPESSGHYTFTFTAITDAHYTKKIELDGPSIEQMIHPVASADFSADKKHIITTCWGDFVDVDVDLRGTGPWNLEVQIIGPENTETLQIPNISQKRRTLKLPIPKELLRNSGNFEINLLNVEDASKCKRPLTVAPLKAIVKRVVPTARFYGKESERRIVVTENEPVDLPLRLTGEKPWWIEYRKVGTGDVKRLRAPDVNANIQVREKGVYELVSVFDSECKGTIAEDSSTYTVEWIPRPSAQLAPSTPATFDVYNGSHILRPICEGTNDHVDLDLTGRPPFQIMYNIAQNGESGGTKIMGEPVFNSIQPRTRFQLHTSTAGRMYYEVKQIGDAAYPLSKSKDMVIPRSQRLLFEQQVSIRPSARFKNRNRLSYCLNDALVPLDTAADGAVVLEGTPPFTLELSIKNIAASHVDKTTIQIPTNTWRLDVPSYTFTSIGPHLITIEKVSDASNCEQAALDPLLRSTWVDVAETAAIIPFERREDICVGDVTRFQLEGIPPWTISYQVNGKSLTQTVKTSPFSIVQQQPGLFTVSSIAHQQKMCKAAVADLRFTVHPLPSAQVGHGKKIFQDIHEGDQAEIVFTLIGEPPFTFTYQRSELPSKKGVPGKVLETHTVSRVQTNEYSIFSALEGTWTVTSISDRYCRYPAQPDASVEKQ